METPARWTLLGRTIYLLKPCDRFVYGRTDRVEVYLELSCDGRIVRHFYRSPVRGSIPVHFDTETFEDATGRERPDWHGR